MKDLLIVGVVTEGDEVIISLFGGPNNVAGSLSFLEQNEAKRTDLARRAQELQDGNVLVDLAFSLTGGRWRLLGKNRAIIGGLEPTKLDISQTRPPRSPGGSWGLTPPWNGQD